MDSTHVNADYFIGNADQPGKLFRHPADRLRVAYFLAVLALDLTVYLTVSHPLWLTLYFFVMILPKASSCAFNHHHQHVPTFTKAWANRLLELVYALQTGVTTHAWVLHHSLGHHFHYLDQKKDESRWQRADGSTMGEYEYALNVMLTAYPRAYRVGDRYPKLQRTFVGMALITAGLIAALVWYRPVPGLFIFVLAPAFSLFGTAWATYAHHVGRSTASHYVASHTVLQPLYNWVTGNLGLHTAHHYKPGVHWADLPKLHAEIEAKIPDDAFVPPGMPWRWLQATPKPQRRPDVPAVVTPAPEPTPDAPGVAPVAS